MTLKHFDVAFDHVSFSYNLQTEVLHDIGFHAKEGSTTALIGPSGSGKSTVANLIARFFDVTKADPFSGWASLNYSTKLLIFLPVNIY